MSGTLLSIIQDAADEVGIPRPDTVINNTDPQVRTLLQMSNREGRDLAKAADWTVLQFVHTITTASGTAEYDLPDDYSRLLRETEWDRTSKRPMLGPVNPIEWQSIKSGLFGSGVINTRYRIYRASSGIGRSVYIDPTPTDTRTLAFEYVSKNWCSDSTEATPADAWAADTDLSILDQDLMTLGLIVRFKRSKGLDFASEADEMMTIFDREVGQDRPSPDLNLADHASLHLLDVRNLPDTGYGS